MFDRYTDRARRIMGLSRQAAQRYNHDYIGTEHILIGLIEEGSGIAASILKNQDLNLRKIADKIETMITPGVTVITMGQLPFTPSVKRVLTYALEEAQSLGHTYIGTEHLLLALTRDFDNIAGSVLKYFKIEPEAIRLEVLELLGTNADTDTKPQTIDSQFDNLDKKLDRLEKGVISIDQKILFLQKELNELKKSKSTWK